MKKRSSCEFFEKQLRQSVKKGILFLSNLREKYMKARQRYPYPGILIGAALMLMTPVSQVQAMEGGSLLSVTEESQIKPVSDGSGKYLLKSNGFYCLNEDGTRETAAAVHYFDHMEIDGTILNGYYYHDTDGKFSAGNDRLMHVVQASCGEDVFDGYYMIQNLGKMTAAPQIRYFDNFAIDGMTLNGFYYFDENGRMCVENDMHRVDMNCQGQTFEGTYYFSGSNGVLVQEEGATPEGFAVDASGKVLGLEELGMDGLKPQLESMIADYSGIWSVYVQNLGTGEEIILNDQPLYSASLIKAFTLAAAYDNMENVRIHEGKQINADPESETVVSKLHNLLWNMIAVSDNESFNETVRLQSENHDFLDGAEQINSYLEREGYEETSVQSILSPSSSKPLSLGGKNTTSVKDCGLLLERIFKGECVSREASAEMLEILLEQECRWKIPAGLPEGTKTANKTGETDLDQHDIAIVYGPKATYILCVMSQECPEGTAIDNIKTISETVYNYLNYFEEG